MKGTRRKLRLEDKALKLRDKNALSWELIATRLGVSVEDVPHMIWRARVRQEKAEQAA